MDEKKLEITLDRFYRGPIHYILAVTGIAFSVIANDKDIYNISKSAKEMAIGEMTNDEKRKDNGLSGILMARRNR